MSIVGLPVLTWTIFALCKIAVKVKFEAGFTRASVFGFAGTFYLVDGCQQHFT